MYASHDQHKVRQSLQYNPSKTSTVAHYCSTQAEYQCSFASSKVGPKICTYILPGAGRCGSAVTSHSSFQLASLWLYGAPGAAGTWDGQKDESVLGQLQPSWFGGLVGAWGGGLLDFMVTL